MVLAGLHADHRLSELRIPDELDVELGSPAAGRVGQAGLEPDPVESEHVDPERLERERPADERLHDAGLTFGHVSFVAPPVPGGVSSALRATFLPFASRCLIRLIERLAASSIEDHARCRRLPLPVDSEEVGARSKRSLSQGEHDRRPRDRRVPQCANVSTGHIEIDPVVAAFRKRDFDATSAESGVRTNLRVEAPDRTIGDNNRALAGEKQHVRRAFIRDRPIVVTLCAEEGCWVPGTLGRFQKGERIRRTRPV